MEKLSYNKLKSISDLTKTGMNLFLHLVFLSDEVGNVIRYSYQSAEAELGMCVQSYYNAINELEKKRHIIVNLSGNIRIIGNDEKECMKGYIYLNRNYFHSKAFYNLKSKEKYLILDFVYNAGASGCYIRKRKDLISELSCFLGVSKRQIRLYLHTLRKCMDISIRNRCYVITPKREFFRHKYVQNPKETYQVHNVIEVLYNEGFECTKKQAKDIIRVTRQYRKKGDDLVKSAFQNAIIGLVYYGFPDVQRREERARKHHKKKVSVPFFHKLFKRSIKALNIIDRMPSIPETLFSSFVYSRGAQMKNSYTFII